MRPRPLAATVERASRTVTCVTYQPAQLPRRGGHTRCARSTPGNRRSEMSDTHEEENQRALAHYDLDEVVVVRGPDGKVLQAMGLKDGEWEILHLHSPNSTRPESVTVTRSRRK